MADEFDLGKEISGIEDPKALKVIERIVEHFSSRIVALEEKVAELSKNSSTSSKPPSSDITKPEKKRRQPGKRKRGGQKGNKGKSRRNFSIEEIDKEVNLNCNICPDCGEDLSESEISRTIKDQSVELPEKPVIVTQHNRHCKICPHCQKEVIPELPEGVIEGQLFGVRLQSLIAYMKGHLGCSYTELAQYSEDVLGVKVSRSMLNNTVSRISEALKVPYLELKDALSKEKSLNIDESGWKDDGSTNWVWIFCNSVIAFFTISSTRGAKVLREVLGEVFGGAITSDFYSAYTSYANEKQQFCLAHLIRDIKFLTTLPDEESKLFGEKVLKYFRRIFKLWHTREEFSQEDFQKKVKKAKTTLHNYLAKTKLEKGKARTMQKRLLKHWNNLFRFFEQPDLFQPTNNNAEQTLRHLIRIRRLTQGSRGEKGINWIERSMSVIESCRKQKRSPWEFILNSFKAYNGYCGYPSLLAS